MKICVSNKVGGRRSSLTNLEMRERTGYERWSTKDYLMMANTLVGTEGVKAETLLPEWESLLGKKLTLNMIRHRRNTIKKVCVAAFMLGDLSTLSEDDANEKLSVYLKCKYVVRFSMANIASLAKIGKMYFDIENEKKDVLRKRLKAVGMECD
jgi:hypothetical protein